MERLAEDLALVPALPAVTPALRSRQCATTAGIVVITEVALWTVAWTAWIVEWIVAWIAEWTAGWIAGWTVGWIEEWTEGWNEVMLLICITEVVPILTAQRRETSGAGPGDLAKYCTFC
jgi:hypothetical protein